MLVFSVLSDIFFSKYCIEAVLDRFIHCLNLNSIWIKNERSKNKNGRRGREYTSITYPLTPWPQEWPTLHDYGWRTEVDIIHNTPLAQNRGFEHKTDFFKHSCYIIARFHIAVLVEIIDVCVQLPQLQFLQLQGLQLHLSLCSATGASITMVSNELQNQEIYR